MTLTTRFIKTQRRHPDWTYRQLAEFLGTKDNVLRGLNAKMRPKLPVPTQYKAPKGQARSKRQRMLDKQAGKVTLPQPKSETIKRVIYKSLFIPPAQTGSGRKHYGGYLKLL